jgi:hypothetical protein
MRIQAGEAALPSSLTQALQGALQAPARPVLPLQRVLVVGAGGTLGASLLAEALVAGRFQQVMAVVAAPLTTAMRGLETVPAAALLSGTVPLRADLAFIVYERARHSNGRDDAFHQPAPASLLATARALHTCGVRRLLVVVPHAPALLPQALRHGFASLAEGEVAALGFEHLLFLRTAQAAPPWAGSRLQRLAGWWLSQLAWMVPTQQQPVRAPVLAALAVQLARHLPGTPPRTRVVPPELLWQAAQGDAGTVLAEWLTPP